MRHGESQNNVVHKISDEFGYKHRVVDPNLSEMGKAECQELGKRLAEIGIQLDIILMSAHRRALQSAALVKKGYGNSDVPMQLMVQIHEEGGEYGGKHEWNMPGLSRSQVLEIVPELIITEE